MKFSSKSLSLAAFVISIASLVCAGIYVASSESSEVIACAKKSTGALRIDSKCYPNERKITWNKTGPQGPQGVQGVQGPQGAQGNPGGHTVQFVTRKLFSADNIFIGDIIGVNGNLFDVLRNGIHLRYRDGEDGILVPNYGDVLWTDSNCSGDLYTSPDLGFSSTYPWVAPSEALPNPPETPYVIRYPMSTGYLSGVNYYFWDNGACQAGTPNRGYLQKLDGVLTGIPVTFRTPLVIKTD